MLFCENITIEKAKTISPVTLAFVGDAVYSLFVRETYTTHTDKKSGELSEMTSKIVRASAQAKLIDKVLPKLTEDEADVFRRGRNAKKPSRAKHSTVSEYNKSTGFEALVGFLYLTGNIERLKEIFVEETNLEDEVNT